MLERESEQEIEGRELIKGGGNTHVIIFVVFSPVTIFNLGL